MSLTAFTITTTVAVYRYPHRVVFSLFSFTPHIRSKYISIDFRYFCIFHVVSLSDLYFCFYLLFHIFFLLSDFIKKKYSL